MLAPGYQSLRCRACCCGYPSTSRAAQEAASQHCVFCLVKYSVSKQFVVAVSADVACIGSPRGAAPSLMDRGCCGLGVVAENGGSGASIRGAGQSEVTGQGAGPRARQGGHAHTAQVTLDCHVQSSQSVFSPAVKTVTKTGRLRSTRPPVLHGPSSAGATLMQGSRNGPQAAGGRPPPSAGCECSAHRTRMHGSLPTIAKAERSEPAINGRAARIEKRSHVLIIIIISCLTPPPPTGGLGGPEASRAPLCAVASASALRRRTAVRVGR